MSWLRRAEDMKDLPPIEEDPMKRAEQGIRAIEHYITFMRLRLEGIRADLREIKKGQ